MLVIEVVSSMFSKLAIHNVRHLLSYGDSPTFEGVSFASQAINIVLSLVFIVTRLSHYL